MVLKKFKESRENSQSVSSASTSSSSAVCYDIVGPGITGNGSYGINGNPTTLPSVLPVCQAYAGTTNGSCCTNDFVSLLASPLGVGGLYPGYSFNHCPGRNMSARCFAFMNYQECNFGCDPYLTGVINGYYNGDPSFTSIPVCANYCNEWFDACKDDYTCVTNWETWPTTNGSYSCPAGSSCTTFASRFVNGSGICNDLWGNVYSYSTDINTCKTFNFYGKNPNAPVAPPMPAPSPCAGPSPNNTLVTDSSNAGNMFGIGPMVGVGVGSAALVFLCAMSFFVCRKKAEPTVKFDPLAINSAVATKPSV